MKRSASGDLKGHLAERVFTSRYRSPAKVQAISANSKFLVLYTYIKTTGRACAAALPPGALDSRGASAAAPPGQKYSRRGRFSRAARVTTWRRRWGKNESIFISDISPVNCN